MVDSFVSKNGVYLAMSPCDVSMFHLSQSPWDYSLPNGLSMAEKGVTNHLQVLG